MNRVHAPHRGLWVARLAVAALAAPIPFAALWLSLHSPGITLPSSSQESLNLLAYRQFFDGSGYVASAYWPATLRGFSYALTASVTALAIAISFVISTANWPRRNVASIAYSLLGLTLLPQTFLVLAILTIARALHVSTANSTTISVALTLTLTPLACWALWLMIAQEASVILGQLSMDRANFLISIRVLVPVFGRRALIVLCMLFAIALGNFVLPFALGDNNTYTSLVVILSFSSNLGRDWASTCAAATLLVVPIVIISTIVGLSTPRLITKRLKVATPGVRDV